MVLSFKKSISDQNALSRESDSRSMFLQSRHFLPWFLLLNQIIELRR